MLTQPDLPPPVPAERFDAGDLGCGELLIVLRGRIRKLAPGQVIEVVTRDPGAPDDLPAWCRLTGNLLVARRATHYYIQRG